MFVKALRLEKREWLITIMPIVLLDKTAQPKSWDQGLSELTGNPKDEILVST